MGVFDSTVKKTAMSKKDYVLIADAIKSSQLAPEQKEAFAKHISPSLRADNGLFKEDRFIDYVMGRGGPSGGRVKQPKKPLSDAGRTTRVFEALRGTPSHTRVREEGI